MATKVFAEKSGYRLVSDERDIMVSRHQIAQVISWSEQMGIDIEQVDTSPLCQWSFGVNLWRVRDEQQRMLFILRWENG